MRLWNNNPQTPEGKYLVQRRDGTVPEWPYFVIGAADPAAPYALAAYASKCESLGMDPQYVEDLFNLADRFQFWRMHNYTGDPDGPIHRQDDPEILQKMRRVDSE